jgi:hypothetical protein
MARTFPRVRPIGTPRARGRHLASFAGDVSNQLAAFMNASQVPFGLEGAGGKVSDPAWRTKPSWYLLTTDDKMIPRVSRN